MHSRKILVGKSSQATHWLVPLGRRLGGWGRFIIILLLFIWAVAPFVAGQRNLVEREQESAGLIRARSHWFFQQRAFPLGRIPAGARQKAIEQMEQMERAQRVFGVAMPAAAVFVAAGSWTPIGPQPTSGTFFGDTSGRVLSLAVDSRDPSGNTVYLGGAEGGVWKSTDGGMTWNPISDGVASLAAASLVLDPSTNPTTIYVGTGEEDAGGDAVFRDSFYGAGVLKSADGGVTWTQDDGSLSQPSPLEAFDNGPRVGALAISPKNPSILLAAVRGSSSTLQSGVWRSTNGGVHWTHVLPTPIRVVGTDVVFDPSDPAGMTAYAALGNDQGNSNNGVYKSTDGGATWTRLTKLETASASAPQANFGRISLGIGPPAPGQAAGTLYAAIADANPSNPLAPSTRFLGLFRTTDGGNTWTQLTNTPAACNSQCFFDMVLRVQPTNPNTVFFGGAAGALDAASIYRTTDGGNSWLNVSTDSVTGKPIHVDFHALAFTPDGSTLYVGNDGGAWSTTSITGSSVSWKNLNGTLQITEFYPGLSVDPTSDTISFAGAQDNGHQKYSGNLAWNDARVPPPCGDGGRTLIDPANNQNAYAACVDFSDSKANLVNKSTDGGGSWIESDSGITKTDSADFVPPLVLDPSNTQTLYFGTFRVYRSTDGAGSWTAVSGDLTGGSPTPNGGITSLAVASSNSNTVYAATGGSVSSTAIIPGKVWVNTNAGAGNSADWREVDTGLPPRWATALAVDPANAMIAYVTFSGFSGFSGDTQGHVFKTINGGTTWMDISGAPPSALPNIPVNDIVIDPNAPSMTLYVATDIGIFATSDGGTTWSSLGSGLPRVVVESVKLRPASRKLRAATHGRSAWDLMVPGSPGPVLNSLSPSSVVAGSKNVKVTLNGSNFTINSTGNFNGVPPAPGSTTFVSSGQLTLALPDVDVASAGVNNISVTDTGVTSSALTFAVASSNADFAFGSVSPSSNTVAAGQAAQYTVPINSSSGFSSGVTLSCNGLPAQSSCNFSPNPVTPPANGGASSALTIQTTARSLVPGLPAGRQSPMTMYGVWLLLVGATLTFAALGSKKISGRRRAAFGLSFGLAAILLISLVACGGGGGGGGGGVFGTPAGTYTITIAGVSGSLQHSIFVTLVVQ